MTIHGDRIDRGLRVFLGYIARCGVGYDLLVIFIRLRTVSGTANATDGKDRRAVAAHLDGVAGARAARLGIGDAADRSAANVCRQSGMGDIHRETVLNVHARQAQRASDALYDCLKRLDQFAGIGGIKEMAVGGKGAAKIRLLILSYIISGTRQVVQKINILIVVAVRENGIKHMSRVDDRLGLRIRVAPMTPVGGIRTSPCSVAVTGRRLSVCQKNDIDLLVFFTLLPRVCQFQRMPQGFIPVGSLMMVIIIYDGHDFITACAVKYFGNWSIV